MSVENKEVIDAISIDKDENVVLTISDHLEWDLENKHLLVLQEKINAYLGAIENGELYENYPDAKDKNIIINIVAKYHPNDDGHTFINRVRGILENAGYGFRFKQLFVKD